MTTHVNPDPTATPATPPATAGWDTLSAALTGEAPVLAERDDLIVTIAPGAGQGHPAVFFPARAAIELDGTHLGVDPATVRPDRQSDRNRYAATWGALTHECAHARHSGWNPPPIADPAVVEVAMLLEESRIEAAHIRRRPDDRHWLRASATAFVIGDSGGPNAAAALAMTDYTAAYTAALVLGRVDGGILDPAECTPVRSVVTRVLGRATLAKLRTIWRAAHRVADDDGAAMLELAQRWLDLIGRDPHADPQPGSALSGAVEATVAKVAAAVTANPAPPDPAEVAAAQAQAAAAQQARAGETARKVFGTRAESATATHGAQRAPTEAERTAARVLARALSTAAARERAVTTTTSIIPPGRLRMRAIVARDAQRAAGAIPTAEPFTRAVRRAVPVPPLRLGIGCDISGSMGAYADPVASAAWILARAAQLATLPGAATATLTFSRLVKPVTYPGIAPARVTEFRPGGSWEAIDEAIEALDGALGLSRPENCRLLVIISDGKFRDDPRARGQQYLNRLRASGCAVLWLAPNDTSTPLAGATVHTLSDPTATATAIARAATTAVRTA